MQNDEFLKLREQMTLDRFAMCDKKAVGYTEGSDDRHANFRFIARELDVPPLKVLNVYMLKHLHSYLHYCKTGEESGDGIMQTIMDLLNYLELSAALIEEQSAQWGPDTPGDVGYAEQEKGCKTLAEEYAKVLGQPSAEVGEGRNPWSIREDGCAVYILPNGNQLVYDKDNKLIYGEEESDA